MLHPSKALFLSGCLNSSKYKAELCGFNSNYMELRRQAHSGSPCASSVDNAFLKGAYSRFFGAKMSMFPHSQIPFLVYRI